LLAVQAHQDLLGSAQHGSRTNLRKYSTCNCSNQVSNALQGIYHEIDREINFRIFEAANYIPDFQSSARELFVVVMQKQY